MFLISMLICTNSLCVLMFRKAANQGPISQSMLNVNSFVS